MFIKKKKPKFDPDYIPTVKIPGYDNPPPTPRKKNYATMFELLHDAEKYASEGEKEVSESLLKQLIHVIKINIEK